MNAEEMAYDDELEDEETHEPTSREGLRGRIAGKLTRACSHFADDPECVEMTAVAVLAALAGDPGDLPARMAEAILATLNPEPGATNNGVSFRPVVTHHDLAAAALS